MVSGGSDSCVLLHEMAKKYPKVVPLYIRNGLLWEEAELYWLKRFLGAITDPVIEPLRVLDLPMEDVYRLHWSLTGRNIPDEGSTWSEVYLPGRNLILLSKAAVFCAMNGIGAAALGPLKTNLFADNSPRFFSSLRRAVEEGLGTRFRILTPFARRDKSQVLRLGRRLPLDLTFSCLNPQGKDHCGACNKCAERMESFKEAGLTDRTVYRKPRSAVKQAALSGNGDSLRESLSRRPPARRRHIQA